MSTACYSSFEHGHCRTVINLSIPISPTSIRSACAFLVVFPLITWLENWSVHLSGNNKDCSAGVLFSVVVLLSTSLNGASRLHNASHCGRVTPTLAWVRIIKFYSAYL